VTFPGAPSDATILSVCSSAGSSSSSPTTTVVVGSTAPFRLPVIVFTSFSELPRVAITMAMVFVGNGSMDMSVRSRELYCRLV